MTQEKYPYLKTDFTFHDLEARAISDTEGSLEQKPVISGDRGPGENLENKQKNNAIHVIWINTSVK